MQKTLDNVYREEYTCKALAKKRVRKHSLGNAADIEN